MAQESGFSGQVISLANLRGIPGRGRQTSSTTWTIAADTQILNENSKRISAIIHNSGAVLAVVYLGNDADGLTLIADANLQIDSLFAWTGIVRVTSAGTTIEVVEISIP
jgi:hypothetical protein